MHMFRWIFLLFPLAAISASAAAEALIISGADCRWLMRHVPDASVAYQPGRDSAGRSVAPADLAGTPEIVLPETITIEIESRLARLIGIPPLTSALRANAQIGQIRVTPETGRAYFENQPLQDEATAELIAVCRNRLAPNR
jgi:hypothetical protein